MPLRDIRCGLHDRSSSPEPPTRGLTPWRRVSMPATTWSSPSSWRSWRRRSNDERRKRDRKNSSSPPSLVEQVALVLAHDSIRHEETEPCAGLLGGEMRLKKAMAMII